MGTHAVPEESPIGNPPPTRREQLAVAGSVIANVGLSVFAWCLWDWHLPLAVAGVAVTGVGCVVMTSGTRLDKSYLRAKPVTRVLRRTGIPLAVGACVYWGLPLVWITAIALAPSTPPWR